MNITEEQYQDLETPTTIKVSHPDKDGTYVIFTGITLRQLDVLKEYQKLLKKSVK